MPSYRVQWPGFDADRDESALLALACQVHRMILEEVNLPHPLFPLRNMMLLWKALNGTHRHTSHCNQGAERNSWRLAAEEEM